MAKKVQRKAIKSEMVDPNKLKPCPWNPMQHPPEQIELLRKSLKFYDQTREVLVDKNYMILAGHGVTEAAKLNGMKEIRVGVVPFTGKKAIAYLLMDNKVGQMAKYSFPLLADALIEIDDGSIDTEMSGFGLGEIERVMTWTPDEKKGKESTGFLDDFISKPGEKKEGEEQGEELLYNKLVFPVTEEQRKVIIQALNKAKQEWDLTTTIEALEKICREYNRRKG